MRVMQFLGSVVMLVLQLFFGIIMLIKATARKIWCKVTGKPYDSGMDM
jgi:hypothetical protein